MTLLEKRMRGLNKDLSGAISKVTGKPAPKIVHRLRTTIRRIESLVSYSHPDLKKKLERSLEKMADLRKRAGKVRDLDVQMGLLKCWGMVLPPGTVRPWQRSWKRKESDR